MRFFAFALAGLILAGCGTAHYNERTNNFNPHEINWIVQARSTLHLDFGDGLDLTTWQSTNSDATDTVNFTVSSYVVMTMSTSNFSVPATITNTLTSFGSLNITNLVDNNLKVCGSNNNTQCTAAAIRVYTTGQSGAGFWDTSDGYGAPLNAAVGSNPTYQTTGLGVANAVYLDTMTIPSSTHVLTQSSFPSTPNILIQGDFTNAGAAAYGTTINVEFVVGS